MNLIKGHGDASRFQRTAKGIFALRSWGLPVYAPAKEARVKPSTAKKAGRKPIKTVSFGDPAEHNLGVHRNSYDLLELGPQ